MTTKDKEENKEEKCSVPPWIISRLISWEPRPLQEARRDKTKDKDIEKLLWQRVNEIFENFKRKNIPPIPPEKLPWVVDLLVGKDLNDLSVEDLKKRKLS